MFCSPLKLSFLVDNNPGPECQAEHGLSIFIEADIKILFDSGQGTLFLDNAKKLGIEAAQAEVFVLSHGHYDHGNGFQHLAFPDKKLVCHPGCFIKRYRKKNSTYIGLKFDKEYAEGNFNLTSTAKPLKLSESVTYLGEIPRLNSFEAQHTPFYKDDGSLDFVDDDSALVIDTADGLVIIAGCSHSGICNIVDYAMTISGKKEIACIVGGFHLKEGDPAIQPTIDYLTKTGANMLLPCHCVDDSVIRFFHQKCSCEPVFSGKTFELNHKPLD